MNQYVLTTLHYHSQQCPMEMHIERRAGSSVCNIRVDVGGLTGRCTLGKHTLMELRHVIDAALAGWTE